METVDMPRLLKTSEDAIPLEIAGTIEAIGGVKMDPLVDGEVETEMTKVDI